MTTPRSIVRIVSNLDIASNGQQCGSVRMMITRQSATPLYEQVKAWIVDEIASGRLAPDQQIPSERRLTERLGVSRITVVRALADLVRDGRLYSVPARGYFVGGAGRPYEFHALHSFTDDARRRGQEPGGRVLEAALIHATPEQALRLQIGPGAEIVSLRRLRLLDSVPVMIQHALLPHDCCPGMLAQELAERSLYAELGGRYGVVLARGQSVIGARLAEPEESALLELAEPDCVLTIDQMTYDRDGRPVEWLRSAHHPRRYPLSVIHEANHAVVRLAARGT
ncbi:MAG TPA: GntR family transcriptional regulator [Thermomicrobiales bacterium]|nr:GntR family transcriptional regulator [Thermomicrobiales bacterium]